MWEPQPPTTLRASTACTGIALPFYLYLRREEVTGDEENYSYYLPDIVNVTKSRRIRWWEHAAYMEKLGMMISFVGKPKRKTWEAQA
jgi:hypothetical protein